MYDSLMQICSWKLCEQCKSFISYIVCLRSVVVHAERNAAMMVRMQLKIFDRLICFGMILDW